VGAAQIIAERQMIGLLVHVGFGSSLVVLYAEGLADTSKKGTDIGLKRGVGRLGVEAAVETLGRGRCPLTNLSPSSMGRPKLARKRPR
jgi:hypothetical protein